MKYSYPAVFSPDKDGWYSVIFPDVPGCLTCGSTLNESIAMAEDALTLILHEYELDNTPVPTTSDPASIEAEENEIIRLIQVDTANATGNESDSKQ